MPRSDFNDLATDGKVSDYRKAYEQGHIKVEGDQNVQKLIAQVIERHEQRTHLRKVQ